MRIIASFLRFTGYLNFIKYPISHVILLILADVLLRSELSILLTSCLTVINPLPYINTF